MKNRFKEDKVLTILTIIDLKIQELERRCDYESNQEKEEQLYYLLIRKQELKSLLDDIKEVLKHDSSI